MNYSKYKAKKILIVRKHPDYGWFWGKYASYPYIGCEHDCIYCYNQTFEHKNTDIKIKENAVELFKKELKNKPIDVITVGDYQPAEVKYKLIRKCLEVVLDFGFPFHGIEKSTIVVRDLDLLKKINKKSKGEGSWGSCVSFSFSTVDDEIARIFEPNASLPSARLKAMDKISSEGIFSGATYMPVLPHITDDDKSLEATVEKVKEHGGKYILFGGLTFNRAFQEKYYKVLKKHYPNIIPKYKKLYADASRWGIGPASSKHFFGLNKKIDQLCQKYCILSYIPRYIRKDKNVNNYKIAEKLYVKGKELFFSGASFLSSYGIQ